MLVIVPLIVAGLVLVINANATDPNFDTTTGIVSMPRVTINNKDAKFVNKLNLFHS